MLFNSLSFVLVFLPLAFVGFHLCSLVAPRAGGRLAAAWLVAMSLLFYYWWNPPYVLLLLGSAAFNYTLGVLIQRARGRERLQSGVLWLGVTLNLLVLCYYKYFFPLLHGLNGIGFHFVAGDVILPLGISFFTFTQIGYLVDCKSGISQSQNPLNYSLFVTFFPHLIAGPILHHKEIMPQFRAPETYRINLRNIQTGIAIFILGLAKKTLIADTLLPVADAAFAKPEALSLIAAWHGALCYSLQLYFDFSGYSEMAMGLALLFNIRFPANFDSPYRSVSVIEYWQRWHMTLTRYINLYIYNPIAFWVTRRRLARGKATSRKGLKTFSGFTELVAYPTFVTLFLAGVWHGAGLQFMIFGLLHAAYLSINHAWRLWRPDPGGGPPRWHVIAWKGSLTYLAVLVGQIFFRASSSMNAVAMLRAMLNMNGLPPWNGWRAECGLEEGFSPAHLVTMMNHGSIPMVVILFAMVWFVPNVLQVFSEYEPSLSTPRTPAPEWLRWRPDWQWGAALGAIGAVALLAITGTSAFLYFQF